MKKFLLILTLFLSVSFHATAATVTWDGGGDGMNWTDPLNWDTDALPTASDDVDLDGQSVILTANTQVQRVFADGSSVFTVDTGVTLTIDGFAGSDAGLEIQGSATLENMGTIEISNITGASDADGFYNKGTTNNSGTITINGVDRHGLYVVAGLFTNTSTGMITVTNVGDDNIYVDDANSGTLFGNLTNDGTITVTMATGDDGIYVNDGSSLTNNATINIIATSGDMPLHIVDNNSVLTNAASGTISITGGLDYCIQVDGDNDPAATAARINNSGAITVTGGNNDGLRLRRGAMFNNNNGATFTLTNSGDEAIQIDDSGEATGSVLTNDGTLDITGATDHGMEIYGAIVNSGTINMGPSGDVGLKFSSGNNGVQAILTNTGIVNVVGGASNHAIQIDSNNKPVPATIDNSGMITASDGGTDRDGLRMQEGGVVNNNAGATFAFVNSGDEAIQIDNPAIFNNSGTVDISSPNDHGMELKGTFNNMTGGLYQAMNCTDDGIRGQSTGVFNNDGAIRINGSGSDDIQLGASTVSNTANATFAPGSSPGELEIREDFDLGSSTTTFEITGTAHTSEYDRIQGTNTQGPPADPAAIFTISNANIILDWGSYIPAVFDNFTIITGNMTVTGTFASVTSTNSNIQHFVDYSDPTKVVVFVIGVLPVELTYFEGKAEEDANYLSWETTTEVNNDYFEVQHSTNGRDFTTLEKVAGYGTTTEVQNYEYLHKNVTSTDNYYRLKQVDIDGVFEYSDVIYLENRMNETPSSIYPNPTYGEISYEGAAATLTFYDIHGRQVMLQTAQEGRTTINTSNLKNGIYTIEILSDANVRTFKKLIKK